MAQVPMPMRETSREVPGIPANCMLRSSDFGMLPMIHAPMTRHDQQCRLSVDCNARANRFRCNAERSLGAHGLGIRGRKKKAPDHSAFLREVNAATGAGLAGSGSPVRRYVLVVGGDIGRHLPAESAGRCHPDIS